MIAAKFLVRHVVAATLLVGGATAFITAVYFGLLAWAIVTDGGLGGPLALPGMIIMVFVATAGSVAIFLFPVTSVAELLRSRIDGAGRFAEIPISSAILLVYVTVVVAVAALVRGWPSGAAVQGGLVFAAVQLVFLGFYWWALQATAFIITLISRLFSAVRTRVSISKSAAV